MLLEIKRIHRKNRRLSQVRSTSPIFGQRKGVSLMIGYVLLITLAIVMSVVAYSWMKTYLPKGPTECPDGVSLFLKEAGFDSSVSQTLTLTLKNNGRFNLLGYYIYATNSSDQPLATIDLSQYLISGGKILGNSISFASGAGNSLTAGEEVVHIFNIPAGLGELYSISVIPTRIEEEGNAERFTSCSGARTEQLVGKPTFACVPESGEDTCGTWICGTQFNNCGQSIICLPNNCEVTNEVCSDGQCVDPLPTCGNGILDVAPGETCDDGNRNAGDGCSGICEIESGWTCTSNPSPPPASICSQLCGNGQLNPGETCDSGTSCQLDCTCPAGYIADGSLGCTLTGNGVCDSPPETCSNPDCEGQQAQCAIGFVCTSGTCQSDGTYNVDDFCRDLEVGYTGGACVSNNGGCVNQGGELVASGDMYCTPQLTCCKPALG